MIRFLITYDNPSDPESLERRDCEIRAPREQRHTTGRHPHGVHAEPYYQIVDITRPDWDAARARWHHRKGGLPRRHGNLAEPATDATWVPAGATWPHSTTGDRRRADVNSGELLAGDRVSNGGDGLSADACGGVSGRCLCVLGANRGFTIGSLLGGVALATQTDTLVRYVPWSTAAVLVGNTVGIQRLTATAVEPTDPTIAGSPAPAHRAISNRGWLFTAFLVGILSTNQVLLNVVIPRWLVQRTDAPPPAGLPIRHEHHHVYRATGGHLPPRHRHPLGAARDADSRSYFVPACLLTLTSHDTVGWVTITLIWLGHVAVTGAELYLAVGAWTIESDVSDPCIRGQ